MATYNEIRYRLLLTHEGFTDYLYLDTSGFLTAGLGYLYERDASNATKGKPDTAPGAHIFFDRLDVLTKYGLGFNAAQMAVVNSLAEAMAELPAAYRYPKQRNLTDFRASPLGEALSEKIHLKWSQERTFGTFKITEVNVAGEWVKVDSVFPDNTEIKKSYFNDFTISFDNEVNQAISKYLGPTPELTDAQRAGFFSVDWNYPAGLANVVKVYASGQQLPVSERYSALLTQLAKGRSVSQERLRDEAKLILGELTDIAVAPDSGAVQIKPRPAVVDSIRHKSRTRAKRSNSSDIGLMLLKPNYDLANTVGLCMEAASSRPRAYDPLMLDLDGDGRVGTVGLDSGVTFDLDANGFAESVGWVSSGDGLLVRDLDENGTIDTGRELFGDQTMLSDGTLAANGFQALAAVDSNLDGKVDCSDAAWETLRVWQDADSDGLVGDGELRSMADAGVTSISLGYQNVSVRDDAGNTMIQQGSFTRQDGSVGTAGNFLLSRDTTHTNPVDYVWATDDVAAMLDIDGSGNVYSLQQSMARNPTLVGKVQELLNSSDFSNLRANFEAMVRVWVGVDTLDAASRGVNIDARQLAVLEAFYGQGFLGLEGPNPNNGAAITLKQGYSDLIDMLYGQYLAQAQLEPVWQEVTFGVDDSTGVPYVDFGNAAGVLMGLAGVDAGGATQLIYDFVKGVCSFSLQTEPGFSKFVHAFDDVPGISTAVIDAAINNKQFTVGSSADDFFSMAASGVVLGLDGNDLLRGTDAAVTLDGGAGDDTVSGGPNADRLYGGTGSDILSGNGADDRLYGGAGNDTLYGGNGADQLEGGEGDDFLDGEAGDDYLLGGAGDDRLVDSEGANVFDGGAGNDILGSVTTTAFWGPNKYIGGQGNDTIFGSRGSDTYVFNKGDGQDVVHENAYNAGGDVLKFGPNISAAEWVVTRVGSDLVLADSHSTDKVTLAQWFDSTDSKAYRIDSFEFTDGTSWSAADVTDMARTVLGTTGDDVLRGMDGSNDIVKGREGDDLLLGYSGDDRLYGEVGNDTLYGGAGSDSLYGGDGGDFLNGEAGNDYLSGGAGDDRLYDDEGANVFDGGDGDDRLMSSATTAFWGPNTYIGGRGQDTIFGSRGGDLYIFNAGDGQDVIFENQYGSGTDILRFGNDLLPADIQASRRGDDMFIQVGQGGDSITVKDWYFNNAYKIEQVEFTDGTVWSSSTLENLSSAMLGSVSSSATR